MSYFCVYVEPCKSDFKGASFSNWEVDIDEAKTMSQNVQAFGACVADEILNNMVLTLKTVGDEIGMISLSTDAFPDASFSFDLLAVVKGAAHLIATNYLVPRGHSEMVENTRNMQALRNKLQECVDVLDDAAKHPEKYE